MLGSIAKQDDLEHRKECLAMMEKALRWYASTQEKEFWDMAQGFGELARRAKERVHKNDYRERDKILRKIYA